MDETFVYLEGGNRSPKGSFPKRKKIHFDPQEIKKFRRDICEQCEGHHCHKSVEECMEGK